MSERFFSSQPIIADRVTLDGPEAHHLLHVMRAGVGAAVTLFDGSGAEFPAVVEGVRRAEAVLRIVERREVDRELPAPLVVGVSLPKGDRQKWLVEKLSELGVSALVPLVTERGVAQPTATAIERLNRSAIEAAKQCGRNRLMTIAAAQDWNDWIEGARAAVELGPELSFAERLVAHPVGERTLGWGIGSGATQIAIGPEGGLTPAEVARATEAGWRAVSLGDRILRVETAAIALAALVGLGSGGGRTTP